jgi:hypothetical protein
MTALLQTDFNYMHGNQTNGSQTTNPYLEVILHRTRYSKNLLKKTCIRDLQIIELDLRSVTIILS